eukprot:5552725-Karenia_brevis.AAC.1
MEVGADDLSVTHGEERFLQVAGHTLKVTTAMKVVGCMVSSDGNHSVELDDKIARATTAYHSNVTQLCCRSVRIK